MSGFSRVRLHTSPSDFHAVSLSLIRFVVQFTSSCLSSLLMYAAANLNFLWQQLETGSLA